MKPEILARRAAYGDTQAEVLQALKAAGEALTIAMVAERAGLRRTNTGRALLALEKAGCVEHYLDSDVRDRRGRVEVKWFVWVKDRPDPVTARREYYRAYYQRRKAAKVAA